MSAHPVAEKTFLDGPVGRLEAVVECRFFGGMTTDETAAALGRPKRTVERDWARARAYLYRSLRETPPP